MFKLTQVEWDNLRSQIATAKVSKVRFLPYAFTEHGVLMLSNVLNSKQAIEMSIQIIRVFNNLRKYAIDQTSSEIRINEIYKLLMLHIENTDLKLSEHDKSIKQIITALNNLLEKPKETRILGFHA